jgi:UDP-GlcNAc3NAcA epimerase
VKVLTVVGARPQFVKAAVVSRAMRASPALEEVLVHTGQHYDSGMSGVFFAELEIPPPDYHLGVGSGTHGRQTGRMLEAIEDVLLQQEPSRVVVYGDTNSTLAGALAAVKLHIPVAHVEAGLRSFNRLMPEEINRVLTDHASSLLFAPTRTAVANLRREGIPAERIHLVGDVMYDAAVYYGARADARSQLLNELGLDPKGYILATVHRAENTDCPERLRIIFEALVRIAQEMPVVIPLHPRTQVALERARMIEDVRKHTRLIDPVGYLDMLMLEKNARLIATDSGGVQKEAFFYHVSCVTLRAETEWLELVELGWNCLAPPTSADAVIATLSNALKRGPGSAATLYGTGHGADRIVRVLLEET